MSYIEYWFRSKDGIWMMVNSSIYLLILIGEIILDEGETVVLRNRG